LGLTILEAYGLTETCPGLTINRKDDIRVGTVGKPFKRCELKIEADGELLARGPNITSGYLNQPDATAAAFDEDGWFRTGDLASIDAEGFVRITGRKKELLKTSGGKYVAPLKIEAKLKQHPIIQEAVVIGDGRNYCTAVFALDAEMLAAFAAREGFDATPAHPRVTAVLEGVVAEANEGLASFERIKTFRVSPAAFTIDGGELTASLKVKRHAVAQKYAALIDSMYQAQGAQGSSHASIA
jgi:long-chain acyl-CoA synthetase